MAWATGFSYFVTNGIAASMALTGLVVLLVAAPARAGSGMLRESRPAAGAVVQGAPSRLVLRFGAQPVPDLCRVNITEAADPHDMAGRPYMVPDHPDELGVRLFVRSPGRMSVSWHVRFVGGGMAHGRFTFLVAP